MKQQYDSYKPSGIDWIGDIPSHWKIQRLKFGMNLINGRAYLQPELLSEGKYRILRVGNFFTNDSWYYSDMELEDNKYCSKGDLLYAWSASIGPYIWNEEKVIFHYHIWKVGLSGKMDKKYSFYLLDVITKVKLNDMHGSAMQHLTMENMNNSDIIVPPLAEQEAIAAWLDEKCGEIDAAIAKVDREIELIDELKQSEISRVVTRGLNPDTPLRPSGIDWIGDIPEHWTIRKTAQLFHGIGSGTTPTSGSNKYYCEDGINWLQTGDLNDGTISDTSKKITTAALHDFSALKIYPQGSIVIAMYGATIGKLGKLNIETATNQACCVLPYSNEIDNDFAFYVFRAGKRTLINSAYGGVQPNISQDTIKSFKLALPPLSEQQAIADYLDKKCAEMDGLKAKLTKKRETLKELRQSIISEVVTGKRKVI